jgi:hypothetical protein
VLGRETNQSIMMLSRSEGDGVDDDAYGASREEAMSEVEDEVFALRTLPASSAVSRC